ncbi:MAG: tetratricopeptide repeat protein [Sphingomonas sp.]
MESAKHSSRTGLIALFAAALVLAGAVSFAALRSAGPEKSAPLPPATMATNQPPTLQSLQERTRAEPTNVDAWIALAQAHVDAGDYKGAIAAYEHGTQLAPQRADIWSALGDARANATNDPMPPGALAAFRKAVEINPKEPRARYFLAVARDLAKDHQGAIDDWLALLRDTPPGAPWESQLIRTIEQVGQINHINVTPQLSAITQKAAHSAMPDASIAGAAIPGPSPDQMRAASALPADQQNAMIQGMVGKLEAKLQANPSNVEGWIMLMRSRMTLGESAKAGAALKAAIAANPAVTAQLAAEAKTLGVPGA